MLKLDDATGEVLWSQLYASPSAENDSAYALALDGSGDIFVAGRVNIAGRLDEIALLKFANVDGELLWTAFEGGAARLDDRALDVAVGPDGDPVLTGLVQNANGTASLLTAKYATADGSPVWAVLTTGLVNDASGDGWIGVDAAGDVLVAGKAWHSSTSYDVLCAKLDGDDGQQHWRVDWTNGTRADDPGGMLVDEAGDVIVVGVTAGDYLTVKLSGVNGSRTWLSTYNGPQGWYDVANGVAFGSGGEILVTGFSDGTGTSWDIATLGYDPTTGAQRWVRRYDGPAHLTDEARSLVLAPGGFLYVTGYVYGDVTGMDQVVLAYSHSDLTDAGDLPAAPAPLAAYPNPFNPSTLVTYRLAAATEVTLAVHDLAGRLVAVIDGGRREAGWHQANWNGHDDRGRAATSGTYVLRLTTAAGERRVAKLTLLK
ncbi:MAG: FlgD immunoglobulin-like domain containing protein [Candidatus Latescibacteria bacterium]|nr:FlgD immunoglobulin-like domain containing protein [Candidatus Latescibacterota bacterium]